MVIVIILNLKGECTYHKRNMEYQDSSWWVTVGLLCSVEVLYQNGVSEWSWTDFSFTRSDCHQWVSELVNMLQLACRVATCNPRITEYDHEASKMKRCRPTRAIGPWKKQKGGAWDKYNLRQYVTLESLFVLFINWRLWWCGQLSFHVGHFGEVSCAKLSALLST